jgi:predicted Zn-dependent protease with MMP-like domain
VVEVEPGRFEEMVTEALDGLPEELGRLTSARPSARPAAASRRSATRSAGPSSTVAHHFGIDDMRPRELGW